MASYIGIDLGTTFSAVSTIDETGRPKIIDNDEMNITPSCVSINENQLTVGEQARKALQLPPHNAIGRFKRDMGTDKTYELDGKKYTPTDLSAAVLKEMKKIAEASIDQISECVVTVPANFSHRAREATMEAAKKAGLAVNYIIDEPTAAALYYAFNQKESLSGHYAVYDLGGGTFDVSIIKISSGQAIDVLASNGVSKLGGDDFDNKLIGLVAKKYKEDTGNKLEELDYTLNEAEEDKKSLSSNKKTIAGGGGGINGNVIPIKQEEFEKEISALITQTEMLCESTLNEAKLKPKDIKAVFLAGGSTRIPCVLKSVERVFKQFPISTVNVDEIVALGAALYAAYMSDGKDLSNLQQDSIKQIKIKEATSKCFGTLIIDTNSNKESQELVNLIIIHKNEKIPCEKEDTVYTMQDNQTVVNCRVTQSTGPETDPTYVDIVHEGQLNLPPDRPEGQPIKVKYAYDQNQMMHCSFTDDDSGAVHEVSLSASDDDSDEESEIDKFLVD